MYVTVVVHRLEVLQSPHKGVIFPGPRVVGSCELWNTGAGN